MSEHAADRALPAARHEPSDVGPRFMLVLFALIGGALLLLVGLAYLIFPGEVKDTRFAKPLPSFPTPLLQPAPAVDMQVFYAQEMRQLNGAGWQDRAAGTVHIPIAQAMRAVAAEGIKGWPAGDKTVSEGDRR